RDARAQALELQAAHAMLELTALDVPFGGAPIGPLPRPALVLTNDDVDHPHLDPLVGYRLRIAQEQGTQLVRSSLRRPLKPLVGEEEVPRQPAHEDRPHEALLNQEVVVTERPEDLLKSLRRLARSDDPPQLVLQGLCAERGAPDALERGALLEVGA